MKLIRILLAAIAMYIAIPSSAIASIECGSKDTPSCGASAATFLRGVPGFFDCPDGSFRDPIKGGQCWQCPAGMERSWKPVTDKDAACLVPHRGGLLYKHANKVFDDSFSCPAGSFYDPRNGGECWTCPAGFNRTAHGVDKYNACFKANHYQPVQKHGTIGCPVGTFNDPRKGGECWSCPRGYRRTANAVTDGNACVTGDVFNLSYKKATFHQKNQSSCPSGQKNIIGQRQCFSCPTGYNHDIAVLDLNSDKACFKQATEYRRATNVRSCDVSKGQFVDPITTDCYSCPTGYIRSTAPVTTIRACVSNASKVAPAEFVSQWGCDESKGEIWDPKNTNGSKLGTCWSCPTQYSRGSAAVDSRSACSSNAVRWKVVPYNDPGMLGLTHYSLANGGTTLPFVEALSEWLRSPEHISLITNFLYEGATQQGITNQSAQASFVAKEWQKISIDPQSSPALYAYTLGVLRTIAAIPENQQTARDKRMIKAFEGYMNRRQIYVAEHALEAYNAWREAIAWRQDQGGNLDNLFGDDYPPPDFSNIAQQTLMGGITSGATLTAMAGFNSWALQGITSESSFGNLKGIAEQIFPNRVKLDDAATNISNLADDFARATSNVADDVIQEAAEQVIKKSVSKGTFLAAVGPQIVVSVATIIAEVRMNQVIEATQAGEKLKEAVAFAKAAESYPNFRTWIADSNKAPVVDKYWSLLSQGSLKDGRERTVIAAAQEGYRVALAAGFKPEYIGSASQVAASEIRLQQVSGIARDIAVSPEGNVWLIGTNDVLYKRNFSSNSWDRTRVLPKQVAASLGGEIWHTSERDDIWRGDSKTWRAVPGKADKLFAGPNGEIWHTSNVEGTNGRNMYALINGRWAKIPGEAVDVAFGAKLGDVWHLGKNGNMYKSNNGGRNWTAVRGKASEIAISNDGTVWHLSVAVTGPGGHSIYRSTNNGDKWEQVQGQLVKISAGPTGAVWGINKKNEIFKLSN